MGPGVRPSTRRAALAAGGLGGGLVLAGCSTFGAPESASAQGEDFTSTWRLFMWIAIGVVALIWGLVAYVVIRYRNREDRLPDQRQYRIPLEVGYTVIPFLVVIGLFVVSVVAEGEITELSPDPDLVIEARGFQWDWQFTYEDEGIQVTGVPGAQATLRLPVGRTVRFDLVAEDVIHSFWVPEFLTKRDLIPGVDNEIDIEVTEAGTFTGRCAEYCGLQHATMTFVVEAVPADEFDRWVDDVTGGGAGNDPTIALVEPTS